MSAPSPFFAFACDGTCPTTLALVKYQYMEIYTLPARLVVLRSLG